jgi:hypothetical protein
MEGQEVAKLPRTSAGERNYAIRTDQISSSLKIFFITNLMFFILYLECY